MNYDFLFTGREFEQSLELFSKLIVQYMNYIHQSTMGIVAGIFSDEDLDHPITTPYDNLTEDDIEANGEKVGEYFGNKVRLFIRMFVPIEDNYKKIKIYFNMHYRVSEEASVTSLFPATSILEVSKVFFTIEEFVLWD